MTIKYNKNDFVSIESLYVYRRAATDPYLQVPIPSPHLRAQIQLLKNRIPICMNALRIIVIWFEFSTSALNISRRTHVIDRIIIMREEIHDLACDQLFEHSI